MSFNSLLSTLVLPVSVIAITSFTAVKAPFANRASKVYAPDSTLSIPIEVINKVQRPTVIVEKEVAIPKGYAYLRHQLSLVSAFPMEGAEQSGDWIVGPGNSWSIYAKLELGCKQTERIMVRASAFPGLKNAEIGAQAVLSVELRKQGSAN